MNEEIERGSIDQLINQFIAHSIINSLFIQAFD